MTNTVGPYDAQGFNTNGLSSFGYDRGGFFPHGWSVEGLSTNGTLIDDNGFDQRGFHIDTGTRVNSLGQSGYGLGYSARYPGRGADGYDAEGLDLGGFDRSGNHALTGNQFDAAGRDCEGLDKDGFDENGFFGLLHVSECEAAGVVSKQHRDTGTLFDSYGFGFGGLDMFGANSVGTSWERD